MNNTLYFRDGIKKIDIVLAFEENTDEVRKAKRDVFIQNLKFEEEHGELFLELEPSSVSFILDRSCYKATIKTGSESVLKLLDSS